MGSSSSIPQLYYSQICNSSLLLMQIPQSASWLWSVALVKSKCSLESLIDVAKLSSQSNSWPRTTFTLLPQPPHSSWPPKNKLQPASHSVVHSQSGVAWVWIYVVRLYVAMNLHSCFDDFFFDWYPRGRARFFGFFYAELNLLWCVQLKVQVHLATSKFFWYVQLKVQFNLAISKFFWCFKLLFLFNLILVRWRFFDFVIYVNSSRNWLKQYLGPRLLQLFFHGLHVLLGLQRVSSSYPQLFECWNWVYPKVVRL